METIQTEMAESLGLPEDASMETILARAKEIASDGLMGDDQDRELRNFFEEYHIEGPR